MSEEEPKGFEWFVLFERRGKDGYFRDIIIRCFTEPEARDYIDTILLKDRNRWTYEYRKVHLVHKVEI